MRIAIFGAGAIGGLIGAALHESGHETSLIARGPHQAAIEADGLTLIEGASERRLRPPCTDDPARLGPQDCVILTLKAPAVPAACEALQPLLGPATSVVTAQNGIPWWYFYGLGGRWRDRRVESVDPEGRQWDLIGPERAIGCVLYQAARIVRPGVIEVFAHAAGNRLPIGEPDGRRSERCRALGRALVGAGFKAPIRPDIRTEIWVKLWGNLSLNPISALTGATLADILADARLRAVTRAMMREGEAVAGALGVRMPIPLERRLAGAEELGGFKTSMLQDLESGRPVELDALTGAVAELGRLVGIATPAIDTVYALTRGRAIEAGCYPG